jgi:hypothetical protein
VKRKFLSGKGYFWLVDRIDSTETKSLVAMADIKDDSVDLDFADVQTALTTQCNPDIRGTRRAFRCTVVHTKVGDVWERSVPAGKRCRKIHISKGSGRDGVERLQISKNGRLIVDQLIREGTEGNFLQGVQTGISVKLTTDELGKNGNSVYYAHVEWYA